MGLQTKTEFGGVLVNASDIGIGYETGAGGAVTQSSNKSTGVTLNTVAGAITMNNASMGTSAVVGFTLTNSTIAATDVVALSIKTGTTTNAYVGFVDAVAAGSCHITLQNVSGGPIAEAVVLNFAVIKAVAS